MSNYSTLEIIALVLFACAAIIFAYVVVCDIRERKKHSRLIRELDEIRAKINARQKWGSAK
jgi:uncharacterized ion transporter superfamily protein YfcC